MMSSSRESCGEAPSSFLCLFLQTRTFLSFHIGGHKFKGFNETTFPSFAGVNTFFRDIFKVASCVALDFFMSPRLSSDSALSLPERSSRWARISQAGCEWIVSNSGLKPRFRDSACWVRTCGRETRFSERDGSANLKLVSALPLVDLWPWLFNDEPFFLSSKKLLCAPCIMWVACSPPPPALTLRLFQDGDPSVNGMHFGGNFPADSVEFDSQFMTYLRLLHAKSSSQSTEWSLWWTPRFLSA